ncbi:asparagine synthase-related protein [Halobacteriaceae archaeon GCM10025711]
MVGIAGVLGTQNGSLDRLTDDLAWRPTDETSVRFEDDRFALAGSFHSLLTADPPAEAADGDVLIWVWGDVYGHGTGDAYSPRRGDPAGSARYCAKLYDALGMDFVAGLNGDFALVVYDRTEHAVSFVTDRVGTHPVFYARPGEDELVFSSNSQRLPCYEGVDASFDLPYLYEYLQLRRVFGVETPLEGVRELPPGSVVTVSLDDLSTETWRYWTPTYDPVDKPYSAFEDEFVDTVRTVLDEWTRDDLEYGVLLSGGSDSRLVRAAMDGPTTDYHIADWMSREATVAKRVADTVGDEFRLLERDESYEAAALERNPKLSNFSGWFDQAYFTGFDDEVADEVDVLVSGLYADMLFAGGPLATRSVSLGSLGNVTLPSHRPIDSLAEFTSFKAKDAVEPLPYVEDGFDIEAVLADNVRWDGDGVVNHGVRYESLRDLVMYGDYVPMGGDTDAIFSRSLMQMRPYRTPFLDNRLLDLQSRIPTRYFLRRNLVHDAIDRLSPALADIPHARTGIPLNYPFLVEFVGGNLNNFRRKHLFEQPAPRWYLDHKPWPDRNALLCSHDFAVETLRRNEDLLRDLPALDYDAALECYRSHLDGDDMTTVLYSLLTLLQMPVTEAVCRGRTTSPPGSRTCRTPAPTGVMGDEPATPAGRRSRLLESGTHEQGTVRRVRRPGRVLPVPVGTRLRHGRRR